MPLGFLSTISIFTFPAKCDTNFGCLTILITIVDAVQVYGGIIALEESSGLLNAWETEESKLTRYSFANYQLCPSTPT